MIYIITKGSYSDYGFIAVCEGKEGLEPDAITKEFYSIFPSTTMYYRESAIIEMLKAQGFTEFDTEEMAYINTVFVWWLKKTYDLQTVAYKEIWISDL